MRDFIIWRHISLKKTHPPSSHIVTNAWLSPLPPQARVVIYGRPPFFFHYLKIWLNIYFHILTMLFFKYSYLHTDCWFVYQKKKINNTIQYKIFANVLYMLYSWRLHDAFLVCLIVFRENFGSVFNPLPVS